MPVLEPQVAAQLQQGQADAPEWARVLAQVLPMLAPGASGAATSMVPGQAQPQSEWGKIVSMLPMLLGAGGMALGAWPHGLRGGKEAALPESMMRTPEGVLKRFLHGTASPYPDFDMRYSGGGAGGDLYGPGIYMTENPEVARGYSYSQGLKRTVTDPAEIAKIYTPGSIHPAYGGGQDKVIRFYPGKEGAWSVEVQAVDQQGNPLPGPASFLRRHMTAPEVPTQPNTRPVYANLTRPFDLDKNMLRPSAMRLFETAGLDETAVNAILDPRERSFSQETVYRTLTRALGGDKALVNRILQKHGYDGIVHTGGAVTGGDPHQVAIAFSPDQVYPSFGIDAWQQRHGNQPAGPPLNLPELLPQILQPKKGN